jgi:hypothetical protein
VTVESVRLPQDDGTVRPYRLRGDPLPLPDERPHFKARVAYAAAHVVCDPFRASASEGGSSIDAEATLAFREYLWSLGLGVAEAMDTAQRGMGLTWPAARELIRVSIALAREREGAIVCGAGTDQLDPATASIHDVLLAYQEQCEFIESHGGTVVMMGSRALVRCARSADDYLAVYDKVLSQLARQAIVHWLGDMFDPELSGYWGSRDLDEAVDTFTNLIETHRTRVYGVKVSLLDAHREIDLRRRLPEDVLVFTGDDINYQGLIRGDGTHHSHALLGIFDAIAPAASLALAALDRGDHDRYDSLLAPTVELSRHVFGTPTRFYKTGLVFLAYLNGHQNHYRMLGGLESGRSTVHLARCFELADQAGLLRDPDLAVARLSRFLALAGVD